jgi:hypothetical protein
MERAVPVIPVDDLAVAGKFYVEGLGFQVSFEASDDGHTGLLGVERGPLAITLDCPMDGDGRNACVSLEVDDADGHYREWQARVQVPRAPQDEPWGARTFGLQDPFARPRAMHEHAPQMASGNRHGTRHDRRGQLAVDQLHGPRESLCAVLVQRQALACRIGDQAAVQVGRKLEEEAGGA